MTTANKFAVITGFPKKGERVDLYNANINDIITYKVNGFNIFSAVIGTTNTMIKVVDLICEPTTNGVNLYINREQNPTTKCLLNPSRRIHKIRNINVL